MSKKEEGPTPKKPTEIPQASNPGTSLPKPLAGKKALRHELNNTLSAIMGYTTLLQRHVGENKIALANIDKIQEATQAALEQIFTAFPPKGPSAPPIELSSASPNVEDKTVEAIDLDAYSDKDIEGCEQILLVEDDALFAKMLKTYLSHLGYNIIHAADGEEGIELFDKEKDDFDAIIVDQYLPKKGGIEVATHIRSTHKHIRMLLLSGVEVEGGKQKTDELEFANVLKKPIPLKELGIILRQTLDSPPVGQDFKD